MKRIFSYRIRGTYKTLWLIAENTQNAVHMAENYHAKPVDQVQDCGVVVMEQTGEREYATYQTPEEAIK